MNEIPMNEMFSRKNIILINFNYLNLDEDNRNCSPLKFGKCSTRGQICFEKQ